VLPSLCPAPAHSALFVHEFLAESNMTVIPHHPYSPNLAHVTYFFSQNSNGMKGKRLNDITMIQAELQDKLAEFQTLQFMKCFKL
jgi:hypothetical protein